MAEREIAVKVQDLTKSFRIPLEASSGLKQKLINFLKGRKGYRDFTPLNDVSFEIEKGDFFGIVGRNGSGKSTLLKTIAGIYAPNKGAVFVNGTLVPFIELGVGFNPELTGRENVFLNGALLGFSRTETEMMYDDIVDFAELSDFMEERLKNYSSGMQVRLAFSIAIRAQADVLLLDEVLAVGDESFQRKCFDYFENLKKKKKTVILVTHDMAAVERFCNKAILVEKGKIIASGSARKVALTYSDMLSPSAIDRKMEPEDVEEKKRWGDEAFTYDKPKVLVLNPYEFQADIKIQTLIKCSKSSRDSHLLAYAVRNSEGQVLFGDKLKTDTLSSLMVGEWRKVTFTFPNILLAGRYSIDLSIYDTNKKLYNDIWLDCIYFDVSTKVGNGFAVIVPSVIQVES